MMRVIVTGGAGFIGSALVRHLVLEKGYEVLNIDALTYAGYLPSLSAVEGKANYNFLHANICDRAAMSEAIAGFRPDRIMHLAAESHVDRSITGAADFVQTQECQTHSIRTRQNARAAFRLCAIVTGRSVRPLRHPARTGTHSTTSYRKTSARRGDSLSAVS